MNKFIIVTLVFICTQSSVAQACEIPVLCADKETFYLRTSNVIDGCKPNEVSLGEGTIPIPAKPSGRLNPTLEARFKAAQVAARKDGVKLKITSGYRSISKQREIFEKAIKKYGSYDKAIKWVAPAELSHHPLGVAIDVNYPNQPEQALWLELNGYKFGLCRVFKNEWWHFEGVVPPGQRCPPMLEDASKLVSKD